MARGHKGFGGNMNCSAYWALSVWDDQMVQTDKKFMYLRVAKEDKSAAETEDDATQRKPHKTTTTTRRRSGGEGELFHRKIYTAVIVGASFCTVAVAISSFVTPKQIASHCIVLKNLLSDHPLTQRLFSRSMKRKLYFVITELAPNFISNLIWYHQINHLRNFGKTRNRKASNKHSVTFDHVQGADAAKAELLEIVSCIKGDSKYIKLGAKLPRGVLLVGPPGTGKTLLARTVAGEAGVAFFSMSASEFVEVFCGVGTSRVRELFGEARKRSPSIIFIDEIDAVGGPRGISFNSERDQTLNQILTEMDGFEKCAKVVVIAATNRPGSLDSALMRPGRFSRKVVVGEPDEDGRRRIFGLYLKEVPNAMEEDKDVICDLVASRTPGLVGADLENIAHESVLLAARRDGDFVTKEDVLQAVERATTKICNHDHHGATEPKSPYAFGQMVQESGSGLQLHSNL